MPLREFFSSAPWFSILLPALSLLYQNKHRMRGVNSHDDHEPARRSCIAHNLAFVRSPVTCVKLWQASDAFP